MKRVVVVSLLLALFALAFPIAMSAARPLGADKRGDVTPSPPGEGPSDKGASPDAHHAYKDEAVTVRVLKDGGVLNIAMSEYLIGVVAAEMPAAFNVEALKAQAVAARTFALRHILFHDAEAHPDADVCADPNCCQAYLDDAGLRDKWGGAYEEYMRKISQAVQSTDGECLVYGGEPIQAVFHSSSPGKTAGSGEVWEKALPYLVSVESPESPADVPNFYSTVTVSLSDFKETVLKHCPDAVFPKDLSKWVTDVVYTESGRIGTLKVGGVTVTGPVLRSMFGLRSTAVSIDVDSKNVVFTTAGYGHGVGMSQYGANALAAAGKSYREILAWYYRGVEFADELAILKK